MDTDVRTPRPPYEEMVGFATRAPSVHNTQPWLWRTTAEGLDLFADWSRQLNRADPDGRDVVLSCGAALHHLRVAAAALGWVADVRHAPDPGYPRLLASVRFTGREPSPEATRALTRLLARQTDRRRFASWPVPKGQLDALARHGSEWGVTVTPVADEAVRVRLLRLTAEADERQRRDPAYVTELATWTRERARDGIPAGNLPESGPAPADEALVPGRYPAGTLVDEVREPPAGPPAMLVVATSSDDLLSRVRAGEALSAVWLDATGKGLLALPLSQATEVDETRLLLEGRELGDRACPQILLCLGWPQADRSPLPRTPRRPVSQVLIRAD